MQSGSYKLPDYPPSSSSLEKIFPGSRAYLQSLQKHAAAIGPNTSNLTDDEKLITKAFNEQFYRSLANLTDYSIEQMTTPGSISIDTTINQNLLTGEKSYNPKLTFNANQDDISSRDIIFNKKCLILSSVAAMIEMDWRTVFKNPQSLTDKNELLQKYIQNLETHFQQNPNNARCVEAKVLLDVYKTSLNRSLPEATSKEASNDKELHIKEDIEFWKKNISEPRKIQAAAIEFLQQQENIYQFSQKVMTEGNQMLAQASPKKGDLSFLKPVLQLYQPLAETKNPFPSPKEYHRSNATTEKQELILGESLLKNKDLKNIEAFANKINNNDPGVIHALNQINYLSMQHYNMIATNQALQKSAPVIYSAGSKPAQVGMNMIDNFKKLHEYLVKVDEKIPATKATEQALSKLSARAILVNEIKGFYDNNPSAFDQIQRTIERCSKKNGVIIASSIEEFNKALAFTKKSDLVKDYLQLKSEMKKIAASHHEDAEIAKSALSKARKLKKTEDRFDLLAEYRQMLTPTKPSNKEVIPQENQQRSRQRTRDAYSRFNEKHESTKPENNDLHQARKRHHHRSSKEYKKEMENIFKSIDAKKRSHR